MNDTSFAYRMLLKGINGKITEHKLERILKKHFSLRYPNFKGDNDFEKDLFPKKANRQLKLINIYGMNCVFCGIKTERAFHGSFNPPNRFSIEHILPKSKGGISHINNCCISCDKCNSSKMSNILPNIKP
jgi:hypothetical protein